MADETDRERLREHDHNANFYAQEIVKRMLKDNKFESDIFTILKGYDYTFVSDILAKNMNLFDDGYCSEGFDEEDLLEYSNKNDNDINDSFEEYKKDILISNLSKLGYDENTDDLNQFLKKCLDLYKKLSV